MPRSSTLTPPRVTGRCSVYKFTRLPHQHPVKTINREKEGLAVQTKGTSRINPAPSVMWKQCPVMFSGRLSACGSLAVLLVVFLTGCRPMVRSNLVHPDADKIITFDASRGTVNGTITQMQIKVGGAVAVTSPGETATYTGGPYAPFSNSKLFFSAVATKAGGSTVSSESKWVYVANPKGVYTYVQPNGTFNGYPASTAEQTGANLYRLDMATVRTHAMNAVLEYANAQGMTAAEVLSTADNMVAAVAWYVDAHMSWRDDATNQTVFANNGFGN